MSGYHDHDEYDGQISNLEGKADDTEAGLQQLCELVAKLAERLGNTDLAAEARALIPKETT